MLLKDVQVGQSCEIERVTLPAQMKRHLEALGMTDHAPVSVLNRKGKGIVIWLHRHPQLRENHPVQRIYECKPEGCQLAWRFKLLKCSDPWRLQSATEFAQSEMVFAQSEGSCLNLLTNAVCLRMM